MVAGRADNHGQLLDGLRVVSVLTFLLQLVLANAAGYTWMIAPTAVAFVVLVWPDFGDTRRAGRAAAGPSAEAAGSAGGTSGPAGGLSGSAQGRE